MLVAQSQPRSHSRSHSPFPGLGPRPAGGFGVTVLRPALARARGSSDSFTACSAVTRFSDECLVIPPVESGKGPGGGAVRLTRVRTEAGQSGARATEAGQSGARATEAPAGPNLGPNPVDATFTPSPLSAHFLPILQTVQPTPTPIPNLIIRDYAMLTASASSPPTALPGRSLSSGTSRPTRPSPPPPSPPLGSSSLLQRRSSRSAGARPNMSLMAKPDSFPVSLPMPLPLPLGQLDLDDTVRPQVVGRAAAADTPASELTSPVYAPTLGTSAEVAYLPTRKFVSTPYPEKKGWLEEDEDDEEEEVDSQKGVKYVASDEDSQGEEEDDYFDSEKQNIAQQAESISLNSA